jgi:NitT/TauT family transport system substrate-binding protein
MIGSQMPALHRRVFLARAAALGAASLLPLPRIASAEPPPEITRIRFMHAPSICTAPQYVAEQLLRSEGFSDVSYMRAGSTAEFAESVADGRADFGVKTAPYLIPQLDAEWRIVVLAGLHAGCYELFAHEKIRAIGDLKGKTLAVSEFNSSEHVFISSMVAYVGMDPRNDIRWLTARTTANAMQLFIEGKADAFLAFPPEPQELRARKIGHVILDTTLDRPWSQYFCCMVFANREFVVRNPIAAKRTLRAIFKAADICAVDPESAALYLVTKGYEPRYEIGLEVLKSLPYARWREANPEDTLRFHALRLHEVGMIKSSPQKLIAQGTDWRFLNELKKELKA